MKRTIVFPESLFDDLKAHLLRDGKEQVAFVLCGISKSDRKLKFLCKELIKVNQEDLEYNSRFHASVKKDFWRSVLEKSMRSGLSVIGCHTHPFSQQDVNFSSNDNENDLKNCSYVSEKIPDIYCASMVFGSISFKARIFNKDDNNLVPADEVSIIGKTIRKTGEEREALNDLGIFDRQVLLFGKEGQRRISQITVGIAGAGGVGSIVFEMLTRLGVGKVILVDDDRIETSNLNRLIGSMMKDVNSPKVEVLKQHAKLYSYTDVEAICKNVLDLSVLEKLKDVDILFACTDTQASRLILNELSIKYIIPLIESGTGIFTEKGFLEAGGRVRVVLPDSFCLGCIDGIDYAEAGKEILSREDITMRQRAGYVQGVNIPSPSVISLNGIIASLGVTEFINLVCGIRKANTYIHYDMQSNNVITSTLLAEKDEQCLVCGRNGVRALGDLKPFVNLLDEKMPENIPFVTTSE